MLDIQTLKWKDIDILNGENSLQGKRLAFNTYNVDF